MTIRFRASQEGGGRAAIWTGPNDRAPFDNPRAHLSRLKFHSDLDYVSIVAELSGTLILPQRSGVNNTGLRTLVTHNGPTHSRSGTPLVLGYITVGGHKIALAGSVLVQWPLNSAGNRYVGARWLSLGANSSRLLFHEQTVITGFNVQTMPALNIPYHIFITDEVL